MLLIVFLFTSGALGLARQRGGEGVTLGQDV
jgi:hypothetical protein